jgi:uncharacterized protein
MQSLLWEHPDSHSLEYFNLSESGNSYLLEGTTVLLLENAPAKVTYRVACDKEWRTQRAEIQQDWHGKCTTLTLEVGEHQTWLAQGITQTFATGIYDVDLEITPASNTLPIRRLGMRIGGTWQFDVVWVRFPALTFERQPQRYTRLSKNVYKFEALSTGFEAQLTVNDEGLVVDYEGLWKAVVPQPEKEKVPE